MVDALFRLLLALVCALYIGNGVKDLQNGHPYGFGLRMGLTIWLVAIMFNSFN
jgi:hypothetical protein